MQAYLVLQNGGVFPGRYIGRQGESYGELVFTTGMVGYMETLTDPSYYGQTVMQTFPQIGNYGAIPADAESGRSWVRGYVVQELCERPSNFRSEGKLEDWLLAQNIVGIAGVDTRAVTKIIREAGVMNAAIVADPAAVDWQRLKSYAVTEAVAHVSPSGRSLSPAAGEKRFTVALLDCGAKGNIVRELNRRGCEVHIFPADTKAEQLMGYDGLMLSNGPGDPQENVEIIAELRKLLGKLPIFGICLGHQLLALAAGGNTVRLKYGHRGANQPAKNLRTGRVFITSQNHGYAVEAESLPAYARLSYINVNDGSCEGVEYEGKRCFSVQFHPEACSGPQDTGFLFDDFLELMGGAR